MGFQLFGLHIQLYGLIIAIAILIAFLVVTHLYKQTGYNEALSYTLVILVVPLSILGARAYFVVFHGGYGSNFFAIWEGGLAVLGGIIVGAAVVFVFTKIKKAGLFTLSDGIVVGVILAQAIGRWGNFTNILGGLYEGYGSEVTSHFPPFTILIRGTPHFSFWLFESVLNFAGFAVLYTIYKRQKKFGTTTAAYLIYYGAVRAVLETFRGDVLTIFGDSTFFFNRASVIIGLIMILIGFTILLLNRYDKIDQTNHSLMAKT